ncbi:MAG: hypothetical protein AAFR96_12880 [Planctomycetota bacterium]
MQRPGGLLALIDHACAPGPPRLAIPAPAALPLDRLIARPRSITVDGQGLGEIITPTLRELAALHDPVADAHAGWLLAVIALASGTRHEASSSMPAPVDAGLTSEGHAWLIAQAMHCAPNDECRTLIAEAAGGSA